MARKGRKRADSALLLALACGATVEYAAKNAGVSERTVYRRLKDPEFVDRLAEQRTEMVERATAMLTAASMEAVKTFLTLRHESNPASVRLGAARSILDFGIKLRETTELTERIVKLEAELEADG